MQLLLFFLFVPHAFANVRDHLMPNYVPDASTCPGGCALWDKATDNSTEQARLDATWIAGKAPAEAFNICAMPGASAGQDLGDGDYNDIVINSFAGPWCYCGQPSKGHKHEQYCRPDPSKLEYPEQINLQMARQDVVVVSFVTRGEGPPPGNDSTLPAPSAQFGKIGGELAILPGVSHYYEKLSDAEKGHYVLSFIKLAGLEEGERYTYRVKSGASSAPWSDHAEFRAPSTGRTPTRFAANLRDDCDSGAIDFIMHMGDHAYDLGLANDTRGDAYMNVFQPTLSRCPWLPIIGNHEANDGDHYDRYLNMTWGEATGAGSAINSSAESALGELLTRATFLGTGIHSAVPSNTSRYFSIDMGMVHIAGLDLNNLDKKQVAWLRKDLAAVDRKATPWVIVSSHFPLFHPSVYLHPDASAEFFIGDCEGCHESYATSGHDYVPAQCREVNQTASPGSEAMVCEETIGQMWGRLSGALNPVLAEFSVDVYDAGHVHDYNSNFPICYNSSTGKSAVCMVDGKPQKDFVKPKGWVNICEGNGGVPGVKGTSTLTKCANESSVPWCRNHGTGGAYGRWTAWNSSALTYEHVENNGGAVTDTFTITK